MLSAIGASTGLRAPIPVDPTAIQDVHRLIVAGDPNGSPADSPADRVDPNTTTSSFAGVGSVAITFGSDLYIGTGTAISPTHVLTAGHCVDLTDDGTIDVSPSDVVFHLNYGSDLSYSIAASNLYVHPDFTGFANPSVNDDVAVIELSSPLPAGVPIYSLNTDPFVNIETTIHVGYGRSGDGVDGYYVSPSFSVKRVGYNHADVYISDDEGSAAREAFEFDFDGPHKKTNLFGKFVPFNLTLGNDLETTLGGGDSGGPAFIDDGNGGLEIFGINTFGFGSKAPAPLFGSGGGGIVVSEYVAWIDSIVNSTPIDMPPTVSVTNPGDGDRVSGTVSVTATASDDHGVTQVEFFVDGSSIGVDTDAGNGWSADWDTTSYPEDTQHTVTATATDTASQTSHDSVTVTVDNIPDPPPSDPEMYVWEMTWSEKQTGPRTHLSVTVDVNQDSNDNGIAETNDDPAQNTTVILVLTHDTDGDGIFEPGGDDNSWTSTAATSDNGNVTFKRNNAPAGNYQATVTGLTHATFVWNPALDADNPDTYTGLPGGSEAASAPLATVRHLAQVTANAIQDETELPPASPDDSPVAVSISRSVDSSPALQGSVARVTVDVTVTLPKKEPLSMQVDTTERGDFAHAARNDHPHTGHPDPQRTDWDGLDDFFVALPTVELIP